jgi:peptidoglycan/xylan/chitin deacetylase (PgdA/CDA1 family)
MAGSQNMKFQNIFFNFIFSLFFIVNSIDAFANPEVRSIKTQEKVVALTFDDGPTEPFTTDLLTILDKHNVKATFFVMGIHAKTHIPILKKMVEAGHEIGNHSMYHDKENKKSTQTLIKELPEVDKIIRQSGYKGEIMFRSPFGLTSDNLRSALTQLNKKNFLFDFLSQDWENPATQIIVDRVVNHAKPGHIIVLHDGGKGRSHTVEATDIIIEKLKSKGYKFVTASELLTYGPAKH